MQIKRLGNPGRDGNGGIKLVGRPGGAHKGLRTKNCDSGPNHRRGQPAWMIVRTVFVVMPGVAPISLILIIAVITIGTGLRGMDGTTARLSVIVGCIESIQGRKADGYRRSSRAWNGKSRPVENWRCRAEGVVAEQMTDGP